MISCSATTPNLSRSSTYTASSLSSSYSSSLITPASTTGPSFVRIHDYADSAKFPTELGLDKAEALGRTEGDGWKGSPRVGASLATAVRRAKTFAKRTMNANVRRVISRTKRRSSVSQDGFDIQDAPVEDALPNPHSVISEEQRVQVAASSSSFPSLSSLREVTHSSIGMFPISLQNKASLSSLSLVAVHGSPNPSCYDNDETLMAAPVTTLPSTPLGIHAARVILFIPWCILVGGSILLMPNSLPRFVSTASGASPSSSFSHTITPVLPPPGPRRFAYWAECAYYHVAIFLGCICSALWWFCFRLTSGPSVVGTCILGALFVRWAFLWMSGFGFGGSGERKRIQLGENDAESVWLVLTERYLTSASGGGQDVEIYVGDVRLPQDFSEPNLDMQVEEDEEEEE